MILSGVMFPFDKLNKSLNSQVKVPIIADMMTSRWAFEALAIHQYKDNAFEAPFYQLNKDIADSDYKTAYWIEELNEKIKHIRKNLNQIGNDSIRDHVEYEWHILWNELTEENNNIPAQEIDFTQPISIDNITDLELTSIDSYLKQLTDTYQERYNSTVSKKEKLVSFLENKEGSHYNLNSFKDLYFNQRLSDIVRKINSENKFIEKGSMIWKGYDPIYNTDFKTNGYLNFRTHFYAPFKPFMGRQYDTFWFNVIIIWLIVILSYMALYNLWLPKALTVVDKVKHLIKKNN